MKQLSMEDFLRARPFFDAAVFPVFAIDRDKTITYFNRAFLPYSRHGVRRLAQGQPCFDCLRTELCDANCIAEAAWRMEHTLTWREVDARDRDHHPVSLAITATPLYGPEGEAAGALIFLLDLTMEARMHGKYKTGKQLRSSFRRYVSSHVLGQIEEDPGFANPSGVRRKVTVLFTDLRDFTGFATRVGPEETLRSLNEYFGYMVDVIEKHGGALDKFIGDSVMAVWGAHAEKGGDAIRAVHAAVELQRSLNRLNERRGSEGRPFLYMGIGINTGEAMVGHVGSEKRLAFTVIGDVANQANRIVERARYGEILIGGGTLLEVADEVEVVPRGQVVPSPHSNPVSMHNVTGIGVHVGGESATDRYRRNEILFRVRFRSLADRRTDRAEQRGAGYVANLGVGGLVLLSERPLRVETRIHLDIDLPGTDGIRDVEGDVLKVEYRRGEGALRCAHRIGFGRLEDGARLLFERFVSSLDDVSGEAVR